MNFLIVRTDKKDFGVIKTGKGPEVRREFTEVKLGKGEQAWLCKIISKRGEGVFNFDDWAAKKAIENAKLLETTKNKQVETTKPPTPAELKKSQAEVDKLKGDEVMKFKEAMRLKNSIKVGLVLLCAFASVATSQAQQRYGVQEVSLPGGSTQFVAPGGSTNINASMDVRMQTSVAVTVSFKMTGTDTGAQTLTFERSNDNATWETLAAKKTAVIIAATSGTQSVTVTNIPTYGAGYIRLATWANGGASESATNITVNYAIKWAQ